MARSGGGRSWPGPPASRNVLYPGPGSGRRQRGQRSSRALPGGYGVLIVLGSAALGALVTALAGGEPGTMLGIFLIAGTLIAVFAVQPRASHLIIPVPALAYFVTAVAVGTATRPAADLSRTSFAIDALQWAARGFVTMTIATALALAISTRRRVVAARATAPRFR